MFLRDGVPRLRLSSTYKLASKAVAPIPVPLKMELDGRYVLASKNETEETPPAQLSNVLLIAFRRPLSAEPLLY